MLSAPEQVNCSVDIHDQNIKLPVEAGHHTLESTSNTKLGLGEAAKVFGRIAYKVPYIVAITIFETPSVCTEFLFGVAGAVVGSVVGSTAILARKCMGAEASKSFGLQEPKSLQDYSVEGFLAGARLGELPGKIIGGLTVLSFGISCLLGSGITLSLLISLSLASAMACALVTLSCARHYGDAVVDLSRNCICDYRIECQHAHNLLQGLD